MVRRRWGEGGVRRSAAWVERGQHEGRWEGMEGPWGGMEENWVLALAEGGGGFWQQQQSSAQHRGIKLHTGLSRSGCKLPTYDEGHWLLVT